MNTPPNQSSHGKRPAAKRPPKTPISKSKREQHVRVKTAKGRRLGSTLWLERQLNDPYVQQAKRDGYRSRSVYKLKDIDEKHNLLHPAMGVVDLGSAPGGWSQYAVQKVNAQKGDGFVIGMDLHHVDPIVGALQFKMDFTSHEALEALYGAIEGREVNGVISDMAPHATGHRTTDHLQILGLCELALEFAIEVLAPDGFFLAKALQGGTEHKLLEVIKQHFKSVQHVKPPSSRADSRELFLLAKGFRK